MIQFKIILTCLELGLGAVHPLSGRCRFSSLPSCFQPAFRKRTFRAENSFWDYLQASCRPHYSKLWLFNMSLSNMEFNLWCWSVFQSLNATVMKKNTLKVIKTHYLLKCYSHLTFSRRKIKSSVTYRTISRDSCSRDVFQPRSYFHGSKL